MGRTDWCHNSRGQLPRGGENQTSTTLLWTTSNPIFLTFPICYFVVVAFKQTRGFLDVRTHSFTAAPLVLLWSKHYTVVWFCCGLNTIQWSGSPVIWSKLCSGSAVIWSKLCSGSPVIWSKLCPVSPVVPSGWWAPAPLSTAALWTPRASSSWRIWSATSSPSTSPSRYQNTQDSGRTATGYTTHNYWIHYSIHYRTYCYCIHYTLVLDTLQYSLQDYTGHTATGYTTVFTTGFTRLFTTVFTTGLYRTYCYWIHYSIHYSFHYWIH